jgi:hypothetical protein
MGQLTMLHRACKYCVVLICCLHGFLAFAGERCAAPWADRKCFGAIEFTFQNPKNGAEATTVRMVLFRNDELLAEIEQGGIKKRYLVARPSGVELYAGLSPTESYKQGNNPFMFFDMGFALPAGALQVAFPQGPSSVPDVETQKDVLVEQKPVTITTIRRSANRIDFRLTSSELGILKASGFWESERRNPLPDDFPLIGWTYAGPTQLTSLQEARSIDANSQPRK